MVVWAKSVIAFLATATMVATCQGTMDIAGHCAKACAGIFESDDVDEKKRLEKISLSDCKKAWAKSAFEGKICRNMRQRAGTTACKLGCINVQTGNVIQNMLEIGQLRRECKEKYAGGANGPFSQKSCEIGFNSGKAFDVEGVKLRVKIDEICAGEEGLSQQAEQDNINSQDKAKSGLDQRAEEERKRLAEEEQKRLAEEEQKRLAEEEQKRLAEEEQKRLAEEEQKRLAEEEQQKKLAQEQELLRQEQELVRQEQAKAQTTEHPSPDQRRFQEQDERNRIEQLQLEQQRQLRSGPQ